MKMPESRQRKTRSRRKTKLTDATFASKRAESQAGTELAEVCLSIAEREQLKPKVKREAYVRHAHGGLSALARAIYPELIEGNAIFNKLT